jgi:hypothetical protein
MAESETYFINGYVRAWNVATTNGFTSLTGIGSGNGLAEFNSDIETLSVDQACSYSFEDCNHDTTLLECLRNYIGATRFCWSDGASGYFRYNYNL